MFLKWGGFFLFSFTVWQVLHCKTPVRAWAVTELSSGLACAILRPQRDEKQPEGDNNGERKCQQHYSI